MTSYVLIIVGKNCITDVENFKLFCLEKESFFEEKKELADNRKVRWTKWNITENSSVTFVLRMVCSETLIIFRKES